MSTPVVVQGTPVDQKQAFGSALNSPAPAYAVDTGTTAYAAPTDERSEKKESSCNDPIFVVLFYIALISIIVVAATYGPDALSAESSNSDIEYDSYVTVTVIIVFISFFGAGAGLAVLFWIPQFIIKVALIFSVVLSGIWAIFAFVSGSIGIGVIGLIFFAISICYACAVWSRIPFATANLVTATTAIRANLGIAAYAYMFAILAGGWSIVWSLAFVGVFDKTYSCSDETNTCDNPSYGILFVLFLAFFFVQQVIQNSIHVAVAGVVGTWWYAPAESGCCSPGVNNSIIRTMTTSFGSICFGSFLVAIVQALRALANQAQQNGDAAILACIAECILSCLASIIEYFNKWAFIYVGLYGMSYLKAGKSVFELFRNRGWEAVIADDLVGNALFLISIVVGGVMGGLAVLIDATSDLFEDAGGDSEIVAFILGFIVGLVITSILMSTIASAVNAVIVLFAEGPAEFQQNHPDLSNKMRAVWNQVYPGSA